MSFLDSLFNRSTPSEEEILNRGLGFAMEFGKNWLQPINSRLKRVYRKLSDSELEEYNDTCQQVMKWANESIYRKLEDIDRVDKTISEIELEKQFNLELSGVFIWINKTNLKKLFSQTCYYAWRDGLDKVIKN
jgi:hypothetical protein